MVEIGSLLVVRYSASRLADPETGLLARTESQSGIWEYFRNENLPNKYSPSQATDQNTEILENDLF